MLNNFILLSSVPPGTQIQIDTSSFVVPENTPFYGIKNISDSIHLLQFQLPDNQHYGYWLNFESFNEGPNVFIGNYDTTKDHIVLNEEVIPDDRLNEYRNFMVNYIVRKDWKSISNPLLWSNIRDLMRNSSSTIIYGNAIYIDPSITTQEELEYVNKQIKNTENKSEEFISYSKIQFKSREAIRKGHEMQDFNDKSYYLNHVILGKRISTINFYLSELSFAFINMLMMGNHGSALQWHSMCELIFMCDELSPKFIEQFDNILKKQWTMMTVDHTVHLINWEAWQTCHKRDQTLKHHQGLWTAMDEQGWGNIIAEEEEEPLLLDSEDDEDKPVVVGRVEYIK